MLVTLVLTTVLLLPSVRAVCVDTKQDCATRALGGACANNNEDWRTVVKECPFSCNQVGVFYSYTGCLLTVSLASCGGLPWYHFVSILKIPLLG
jgi:hypothetical protein